jgi:ubiquinone/menaquinone biosynthesis C-methylase UbiE
MLAKNDFEVYGTDISKEGMRLTLKDLKILNLKAKLKLASCYEKFPFKDNSFDAIISTQVIHHNYHNKIKYCISEIERVLKSGGILFVTVAAKRGNNGAKKSRLIKPRTYLPLDGDEKGLPHYLYNKELMKKDFENFRIIKFTKDGKIGGPRHYCLLGKLRK